MKYMKSILLAGVLLALAFAGAAFGSPLVGLHGGLGADTGIGIALCGMLVNKEAINNAFIGLKTTFNNAFASAPSTWDKIAMKIASSTKQNDYAWLSNFPRMRAWVGDKNVKSLEAFKYSIPNVDWEATIEVDRNDIEDDQLGIYATQAQMAGFSAKTLPDEIVMDLVNNGFTSLGFDGKAYFATDHVVNGASVANRNAVALSAASQAAALASYGAARTAMRKFKDDEGRPLNITPEILLVPPALETIALVLVNNDRLDDGKANPFKGTATVVCDARLISDTAWFLLDTSKPVKPFIYQERKAPVFVSQTDMQADDVFNRKKFKFGAEARAAGGYGFWQLAFGSTGA